MKRVLYAFIFLSLLSIDFGVKTYEMFLSNAESIELLTEKKSEKEVEDVDKLVKLVNADLKSETFKRNDRSDYSKLYYSSEQIFGEIPEPPPDLSV